MRSGRIRARKGPLALLMAAVLVITVLHVGCSVSTSREAPGPFHDEAHEPNAERAHTRFTTDLTFYPQAPGEVPVNILADVAVDEEFVDKSCTDCQAQVLKTVDDANALLRHIDVGIIVASIQLWQSDDTQTHLSMLMDSAARQVQRASGNLFLVITGQQTVTFDGYATDSQGQIGVHFYPEDPRRNSSLIAHELGHLLGADHHEDEEKCTGEGCLMDRRDFAHATRWCDHHRDEIKENIASALTIQTRLEGIPPLSASHETEDWPHNYYWWAL